MSTLSDNFREQIQSFHDKFEDARNLTITTNSICKQTTIELQHEATNLLYSSALLAKYNYLTMRPLRSEFEEAVFPLKEFKVLSISVSLKMFTNPNHKDRYNCLIDFLRTNPKFFSQVIYFMMVPQSDSAEYGKFGLSEDEKKYFCYQTIPSIYNFFLSNDDKQYALELIESLLKLHYYIHGPNFSSDHRFLKDIVFSYFLFTNPSKFFDNVVQPLLSDLMVSVDETKFKYSKETGGIFRTYYFRNLAQFVILMFQKMNESVPLLPTAARELIIRIAGINYGRYPIKYVFIIETMICGYLKDFIKTDSPELMKDICKVIRCCYPQEFLPCEFAWRLGPVINEDVIDVDKFIRALNHWDTNIDDGLTYGLAATEKQSLFTSRDFMIIYNGVKNFIDACDKEVLKPLESSLLTVFQGITAPKFAHDSEFILMKAWKSTSIRKVELKQTQSMDVFVDSMNLLDFMKIPFKSPSGLTHYLLKYCDSFLDIQKKVHIDTQQELLTNNKEQLIAAQENHEKLAEHSNRLFSSLFFICNKKEKIQNQLRTFHEINIQRNIIPNLLELFPFDILNITKEMNNLREIYINTYKDITKYLKELNILPELQESIVRDYFFEIFEQISKIDQQFKPENDINDLLYKFNTKHSDLFDKMSPHNHDILNKAKTYFQKVVKNQTLHYNTKIIIQSMNVLRYFDDIDVQYVISMSLNAYIFQYISFFKTYMNFPKVINYFFTPQEQKYIQRLHRLIDEFN